MNNNSNIDNNLKIDNLEKVRKDYYSNVTRFANIRTFLALLRTCAVFVALAIYMKNKYIFMLVGIIIIFGSIEFYLTNLKIKENDLEPKKNTYFNLAGFYSILFLFIFCYLFFYPPFKN
tara:strand:- start:208 stop:564 length:357 start_codon:yes stop_codon:yes gene_type:complete